MQYLGFDIFYLNKYLSKTTSIIVYTLSSQTSLVRVHVCYSLKCNIDRLQQKAGGQIALVLNNG